jgi:amino acid transporter
MKIQVILLIIFSAFTMNLAVQCALGIKGASESKNCNRKSTLIKLGVIFISVIFLWFFFVKVIFFVT